MIGAVDIGGTKIAVGLVDEHGRIAARAETPTSPQEGFEHALTRIRDMLRAASHAQGVRIDGIGVACTGPVDPVTGIVGNVGLLPGWRGANLVESLGRVMEVPVAVENDADAAALAEACWGSGKGTHCLLYVAVGTGIGGGIVIDGALYRGAGGAHPEFGHQVIDASGPLCYCGARGCWEALASGTALAAWARQQGQALDARELFRLAEQGDSIGHAAAEREGRYLGLGLANLVTTFCPDRIVLGGGVMNGAHLFLEAAREIVRMQCKLVPADRTVIAISSLKDDAGLLGAARVWQLR